MRNPLTINDPACVSRTCALCKNLRKSHMPFVIPRLPPLCMPQRLASPHPRIGSRWASVHWAGLLRASHCLALMMYECQATSALGLLVSMGSGRMPAHSASCFSWPGAGADRLGLALATRSSRLPISPFIPATSWMASMSKPSALPIAGYPLRLPPALWSVPCFRWLFPWPFLKPSPFFVVPFRSVFRSCLGCPLGWLWVSLMGLN
jgi:hypothetical protein